MMTLTALLSMPLGKVATIDEDQEWYRVPGGWIVYDYDLRSFKKAGDDRWHQARRLITAVFVPEPHTPPSFPLKEAVPMPHEDAILEQLRTAQPVLVTPAPTEPAPAPTRNLNDIDPDFEEPQPGGPHEQHDDRPF